MTAAGIFPTDEWTLVTGDTPDGPLHLRFRTDMPSEADRVLFKHVVLARWRYRPHPQHPGMPTGPDMSLMTEFEDLIIEASDTARSWGSAVAIVTHNGMREWRFYTPDVELFQQHFNEALAGYGPYPLEFEVFDDPEWLAFHEVKPANH